MNTIFQEHPFENGRPTTGGTIIAGCDMRMGPGGHAAELPFWQMNEKSAA
jgi:hypothetical protein